MRPEARGERVAKPGAEKSFRKGTDCGWCLFWFCEVALVLGDTVANRVNLLPWNRLSERIDGLVILILITYSLASLICHLDCNWL